MLRRQICHVSMCETDPNVTLGGWFAAGGPLRTSRRVNKKKGLRIAWPGGQNVRTLRESRFHHLSRPHLPYGEKGVLNP